MRRIILSLPAFVSMAIARSALAAVLLIWAWRNIGRVASNWRKFRYQLTTIWKRAGLLEKASGSRHQLYQYNTILKRAASQRSPPLYAEAKQSSESVYRLFGSRHARKLVAGGVQAGDGSVDDIRALLLVFSYNGGSAQCASPHKTIWRRAWGYQHAEYQAVLRTENQLS